MSTEQQRQAIKARLEAIEYLPWWVEYRERIDSNGASYYTPFVTAADVDIADVITDADADRDIDPNATFIAAAPTDITALLADVDRLTGDNAALSEALDTALLHLKESEADRDKAIAELATVRAIADKTRQAYQAYRDAGASIGGVQFFAFDEWLDWMADAENGPAADACVDNAGYCKP
jgi:hypothetical protein